jgi:1-acyl-sn-glycerol-3-phosphate acyltransferase
VGLFPEGTTTEGDQLLKFHSSLFEPAVAHGTRVHPVALRYLHPDGTPCRAAAFVGELTFAQSLGLVIRTRAMVVRIAFSEPVEPAGRNRREVAAETHARVATLLGLAPAPDNAPGTDAGR